MFPEYDVVIVGAGHAGCEAAVAAARMGSKVMLVTMNMNTIAQLSCNPAMGGVAKGQITREIDALGGYTGIVSDETAIQFRMLNKSKGPAMWSPRTQNDRMLFHIKWREMLEQTKNIDLWQEMVTGIVVKDGRACGVRTQLGLEIPGKTVILTNGTFLNGIIHVGEKQFGGGRSGERAATGLTAQLETLGFESGRMKTGTPPRIDARSINYDVLEEQPGDENPSRFSFTDTKLPEKQIPCHIGYTSPEVHDELRKGFDKSPMFNGRIRGIGPRYCPSIEDKIDRFAERERHQLFIEPEGWNTVEVYLNGFSSSLPMDVQYSAMRKIRGFENAKMFRPGYAIEYDFFQPTQLKPTLETHLVKNLFFAGQINGSTGYEEAACQGFMAGINAHLNIHEREPFILKRSEAYIGVLIDDLINKGTKEPYRMFTSRAEYRIMLRQDNADFRLTHKMYELGMFGMEERMERIEEKLRGKEEIERFIKNTSVSPDQINGVLSESGSNILDQSVKMDSLLRRPQLSMDLLADTLPYLDEFLSQYDEEIRYIAEVEMKYDGYIKREQEQADKMEKLENMRLPENINYDSIKSLSKEAREKLTNLKPHSIGQASRIMGVSPADISVLLIHMGR